MPEFTGKCAQVVKKGSYLIAVVAQVVIKKSSECLSLLVSACKLSKEELFECLKRAQVAENLNE